MDRRYANKSDSRPRLTARQQQALDYITRCVEDRACPPTLREIGAHMGIRSTNGVNDHLCALERKGYVRRDDLKSRALRLVPAPEPSLSSEEPSGEYVSELGPPSDANAVCQLAEYRVSTKNRPVTNQRAPSVEVPLVGDVAAGLPALATEAYEESLTIDRSLIGANEDVFALKVRGESMIDDGIFDGDLVFVRRQSDARRGEITVVLVDDEATVKRYYPEGDRLRLEPANSTMASIYIDRRDHRSVQVLGVVVGVFRSL